MSSFGAKRKARKIKVDEEDDAETAGSPELKTTNLLQASTTTHIRAKPFKKSALRQTIAFDDEEQETSSTDGGEAKPIREVDFGASGSSTVPSRPGVKRAGPPKRKPAASRLSFGPGEIISGDAAEALEDDGVFVPKKAVPRRGMEPSSLRLSLPVYQRGREGEEEERPSYSKDYLMELKTSTPSTPREIQHVEDEEGLDESELEGAMVVDSGVAVTAQRDAERAYIPTEAEIAEKKQRRARLAQEQDFISLDDGGDRGQVSQISLLPTRKKETRLERDDAEVMEGFDEFVDDGRVALGRKAERKARKLQRTQMAQAIQDAEGGSSAGESDDSEAERVAQYEAAQTRAGMDGLHKPETAAAQVPPRVTAIPSLTECLARLQSTLSGMETELARRNWRLAELQREKAEITAREAAVQELLREAGERYAALRADPALPPVDPGNPSAFAPGRGGLGRETGGRGLESFGNTPVGGAGVEDVG